MQKNQALIIVAFLTLLMSGVCKAEETKFVVSVDVKNAVTHHAPDYVRCHVQQFDEDEGRWVFADVMATYHNGTISVVFDRKPLRGGSSAFILEKC